MANTLLKQALRLLAASANVWCMAECLPVSSLGLRMDNNTVRVAVGLRLR